MPAPKRIAPNVIVQPREKTPDELLREAVNAKGLEIVQNGFKAIDDLATALKKEILGALIGKKPRR